jgi:hypothetical protein
MTYVQQDNLAHDSQFLQRVRIAMITAAVTVQAEAPATPNHTNRSNYAKLVLNAPDAYVQQFSEMVASNVAISANSLDSDILFTVNTNFSAMAGMI